MTILFDHTFEPLMTSVARALDALEESLADVPPRGRATIMVAADEIISNIVRYSGATAWSLRVDRDGDEWRFTLTDDGKPFDPLAKSDPDTTLSAEDRAIGGMGIFIVKKTMSSVSYARTGDRNVLTMTWKDAG